MLVDLGRSHEVIYLYCQSCGVSLALDNSLAGKDVQCPSCGELIKNVTQEGDAGDFEVEITVSERARPVKTSRRSRGDSSTSSRLGKNSKNFLRIFIFALVALGLLIALGWWFL